ncbi:3124_t:CDS:2 [Funneliformis geosporum]|uniref:10228_t:CDS:1 n=1 Tax=Funneliformis geosporum TaxID=1117311 RepID=A0A9W4WS62_9GLOM|nr:10228_t:CDS:2 [Funneliformis geosporum]CAI2190954.1 3124_t:CDS:2 [Funneliformis geosporum]
MTDLPNMPSFDSLALKPEQRCNKVFNAIIKTLLHNRNQWMTAMQLVEDCRKLDLAQLRGNTPRATIQGAISTGLSTARSLKAEPPIEKYKATYGVCYRISLKLFPKDSEVTALMDMNPPPDNVNQNPPITQTNRSTKSRKQLYHYTSESDSEESDSDDSESDGSETDGSDTDSSDDQPSRKRIARYHSTSDFTSESDSDSSESDISMDTSQQDTNDTLQNEIDDFNSSLCTTNEPSDFDINLSIGPTSFAVAQEIGYSYARFRHQGNMRYPKSNCEDSFCIKDLKNLDGSLLCRLFCLADGHGGPGCSAFLTTQIPECIENMLRQYDYSQLDDQEVQDKFKQDMILLIKQLDDEYLEAKREEYLRWQVHDTSAEPEPVDDGATLVINLFFGEWFININVGDSRTLIGCKIENKWIVEISSEDHKPYLERLALQIYSNGGVFVDNQDKPIKFDPFPQDRNVRPNLKNARIRLQAADNDLGVPYKNSNGIHFSLNVAATCGDLLFKLDPSKPVISCMPDIFFEKLGPFTEYSGNRFMLMSSDGLFDHLYSNKAELQNQTIATCIGQQLDAGCQLKKIVAHLCNREGDRHLFENTLQEYDDCTCILVLM